MQEVDEVRIVVRITCSHVIRERSQWRNTSGKMDTTMTGSGTDDGHAGVREVYAQLMRAATQENGLLSTSKREQYKWKRRHRGSGRGKKKKNRGRERTS
jgi:hypothetical protein